MANDEEELSKPIAEPGAVPGLFRHETPVNGGQSQSPAEPERAATQLPGAELSVTAPPEAQSPGEAPEALPGYSFRARRAVPLASTRSDAHLATAGDFFALV